MKGSSPTDGTAPSALQRDLVRRIATRLAQGEARPGERVPEPALAAAFGVSRTPVRAALLELARQGHVRHEPNRGFVLVHLPPAPPPEPDLADRILADRAAGTLPADVSEAALIARYGSPRGTVRRALLRLSEEGLVRRAPGHGWQFTPSLEDSAALDEARRFRLAIEPAALLQPGWRAPPGVLERLTDEQTALLRARGGDARHWASVNDALHGTLAECSGNRFFAEAMRAQNALRRLTERQQFPTLPQARIRQSCREHLAILAALRDSDRPRAAALMEVHLRGASDYSVSSPQSAD
ncbi:GntR family transcriptional regulator [Muricoccus radiodurans]|uniref:GntR family transcriptional regulator n=1 Tax=Muricoccus radiodurans TaxID=2231721 RepID=UPI003CEA5622